MFGNIKNIKNLNPLLDGNLSFIPDGATNSEIINILEFSFEFLLANQEELVSKFGGKAFQLLLAKSLENKSCFYENKFYIPAFKTISTDFYQGNKNNKINGNDLQSFEFLLNELNNFGPNTDISEGIKGLILLYLGYKGKIDNKSSIDFGIDKDNFDPYIAFARFKSEPVYGTDTEFAYHNESGGYNCIKYKSFKGDTLKIFLQNNTNVLKHILENLTDENLISKYSFLLDFYLEHYDCDEYKTDEKGVYIFKNGIRIYLEEPCIDGEFKYGFVKGLKIAILEFIGITKRKTDDEIKSISDFEERKTKIIEEQRGIETEEEVIWFLKKEDIRNQAKVFFGETLLLNFDGKQEEYLKKVFDNFSGTDYIAVRSSADIEDTGERNYSGVFYSGFCSTKDFEGFKQEVKKVLQSAVNVKEIDVKMGIIVMEVSGKYDNKLDGVSYFYPDGGGVMATTQFGDRTTISAEFGLPVGITSGKNDNVKTIDFDKNGNPIQACVKEYTSYENMINNRFVISDGKIVNIYHPERLHFFGGGIGGIFDEDIYKNLVFVGKKLESIFGYPLDIEFAINNGEIHILQIRKFPDNYKKPEDMTKPDLEGRQKIVDGKHILSSLGFLNNELLHFYNLHLPFTGGHSYIGRGNDNKLIIEKLEQCEQKNNGNPYVLILERLETFPNIDRKNYPGLKLIIFKSNDYKLSHAYMILRELGISTIIINGEGFCYLEDYDDQNLIVYLDGNNGGCIYK